jgi:hypothetical protein
MQEIMRRKRENVEYRHADMRYPRDGNELMTRTTLSLTSTTHTDGDLAVFDFDMHVSNLLDRSFYFSPFLFYLFRGTF